MRGQAIVYETLEKMGIAYGYAEHIPVFTVEEMEKLPLPDDVVIAKNLFLRDHKGKRHFLVVVHQNKNADLKRLGEKLGTRLSFASEERLEKYLDLKKGSVSPLAAVNDGGKQVEFFFDRDLEACPRIGVHPNDNSATLFMTFADIVRVVEEHGNPVAVIDA